MRLLEVTLLAPLAALGRAFPTMPLLRREDDIEVRRVPALPVASMLDPERPTVVLVNFAVATPPTFSRIRTRIFVCSSTAPDS
mgnify:CR=1 FL=1